jgi:hypothetical protein
LAVQPGGLGAELLGFETQPVFRARVAQELHLDLVPPAVRIRRCRDLHPEGAFGGEQQSFRPPAAGGASTAKLRPSGPVAFTTRSTPRCSTVTRGWEPDPGARR